MKNYTLTIGAVLALLALYIVFEKRGATETLGN